MPSCCDPQGCDGVFGERFARHRAGRYRRRGLDATERRMIDFLAGRGLEGASVLEIGGGVGELSVELLRRGAARATNCELVPTYDALAGQLAAEAGVAGRLERRLVDIAMTPEAVEPADIVLMHRVVCCYPDVERLLGAVADHTRRLLVFSHPPRTLLSRAMIGSENLLFRVTGKAFRVHAHPPAQMLAALEGHGLAQVFGHGGLSWQVAGLERAASPEKGAPHGTTFPQ